MKKYLDFIRVHQGLKNIFVFAPLFFSDNLFNHEKIIYCVLAFIAFNINASSIYIINDYKDIYSDRKHPTKKFRALAAGTISKNKAISWNMTVDQVLDLDAEYLVKEEEKLKFK